MLDYRQKKIVDKTWDSIWSNGVTNPIVVFDLVATILMVRKAGVEVWDQFKERVESDDIENLVKIIRQVRREYALAPGSEIETREFWLNSRVLEGALAQMELLLNTPGDIIGDIFEHFLAKLTTAGTFGQFRTPQHLVNFLVELVKPGAGELVMDPACGTGSFLIQAAQYRRENASTGEYLGFEIDRTISRIAQANLVIHGINEGVVVHSDGLVEVSETRPDVILANPPFAGSVSPEVKRALGLQTSRSELLFLRTMIDRLAVGGRAAVIVPAGVLASNMNVATSIRERLVEDMTLEAVIELPANAFAPYTGVRTGILLWQNKKRAADTNRILMIRVDNDGYSLDSRRAPIKSNDLPGALAALSGADAVVPHAYVSVKRLRESEYNLTPSRYIEISTSERRVLTSPNEALREVEDTLRSLTVRIAEIKEILK